MSAEGLNHCICWDDQFGEIGTNIRYTRDEHLGVQLFDEIVILSNLIGLHLKWRHKLVCVPDTVNRLTKDSTLGSRVRPIDVNEVPSVWLRPPS